MDSLWLEERAGFEQWLNRLVDLDRFWIGFFHRSREVRTFIFFFRSVHAALPVFFVLCRVAMQHILRHSHHLWVQRNFFQLAWNSRTLVTNCMDKRNQNLKRKEQDSNCHRGNFISWVNQMCVWFVYVFKFVRNASHSCNFFFFQISHQEFCCCF